MVQEMEMMVFIHNLMLGLGGALDLSGMGAWQAGAGVLSCRWLLEARGDSIKQCLSGTRKRPVTGSAEAVLPIWDLTVWTASPSGWTNGASH